ncbi:MAG TPA: hypothetical protein VK176_00540 [Phycisphaerales bacterium]|nr:hypothetical protein [Phycisphaerales bacterium]
MTRASAGCKRGIQVTVAMLAAVCGLAASARADLPPIMDKAPEGALGVIAIRNMDQLHGRVMRLVEVFEADVEGSPIQMMEQMLNTPGLTKDGSAMIVLLTPQGGGTEGEPRPVMVVPVSDAKAFTGAMNAQGTGVMTADLDGQPVYMKDGGNGYVFMSPVEGVVDTFTLGKNSSAGLKKAMGSSGSKAADTADLVVYLTAQLANEGLQAGTGRLKQQAEVMIPGGPDGQNPVAGMAETADHAADAFEKEGQAVVMTLTMDDAAVVFDMIGQFKEGTEHSKMFQIDGKASTLSKTYPSTPFLLAMSMDMSSPQVREWVRALAPQNGEVQAAGLPMDKFMGLYEKAEGYSMQVGIPPAGLMGGMLTSTTAFYQTKDPAGFAADVKSVMESINGLEVQGMKFKSTYKAQAVESNGKKFDSWQMVIPQDMNDPTAQQAAMMIWGMGPGPSGLVAQADNGVILTMGSSPQNMSAAIDAANGKTSQLSNDEFGNVVKRLPPDRLVEAFVGVKGIIDMVGPFIAMQTGGAPFKTPEKMGPVALAGAMNGGAMSLRIVIPNDVIETISDIAAEMQAMGGDAEEPMEGDEPAPEGENRPPRF